MTIVTINKIKVDVAEPACRKRACFWLGYVYRTRDARDQPRPVCGRRHATGCPTNSVCATCKTASVEDPGSKCDGCGAPRTAPQPSAPTCQTCTRPTAPGYSRCERCRESERNTIAAKLELGLCRRCGTELPTECATVHCEGCLAVLRERRAEKLARKECERCSAPTDGRTLCGACIAKRKAARSKP